MSKTKIGFSCKVDEIPVIARFLHQSLERDINDFQLLYPNFNQVFLNNMLAAINDLEVFPSYNKIVNDGKLITKKLYEEAEHFRTYLIAFESFTEIDNNQIEVDYFQFSETKRKISKKDIEGFLDNAKIFIEEVERFETQLQTLGFHSSYKQNFKNRIDTIKQLNLQQNLLIGERNSHASKIYEKRAKVWRFCRTIAKAGKNVYKATGSVIHRAKRREYTIAVLRKRVNNSRPRIIQTTNDSTQ